MARTIRRTMGLDMMEAAFSLLAFLVNRCFTFANIANGTTNGKLKTQAAASFAVDGAVYTKAATDDLWTLSGIATMSAGQYRAITLYMDAAGTATIDSGTVAVTAALALAAAPAAVATKSIFGVFVAGPSTNFANALTSQGTLYHGVPAGYGTATREPLSPAGLSDFPTTGPM